MNEIFNFGKILVVIGVILAVVGLLFMLGGKIPWLGRLPGDFLANPVEFGERLVGLPFALIDRDGAPKGKKFFLFYNPYFDGAGTLSAHQETRDLFLFFTLRRLQTLCFTMSRRTAELIARWSKKGVLEVDPDLAGRIAAYRAGYLPEERRELEDRLKRGDLIGVTSTNALELGIDVGSLDCVILSGYPGT